MFGYFDGRRLTLDELGLSEDDLAQIDSRQNPADFFDFAGKFWLYRFSREIGVFSASNAIRSRLLLLAVPGTGRKRFLNIRKFEGEPFTAAIWVDVEPTDITVYRGAR